MMNHKTLDEKGVLLRFNSGYATNPLVAYTNKYIIAGDHPYQGVSTRCFSIMTFILQCMALVIGGCAGLPWVSVGEAVGDFVDSRFVYVMAAYGGLVTYGITSIWAFHAVLNFLDKKTPEENKFYKQYLGKRKIKILFSQIIGVVSSLPTVYTANEYNRRKIYVVIAALVSYAFNALGIYKLIQYLSALQQTRPSPDKKIFLMKLKEKIVLLENQQTQMMAYGDINAFYQSVVSGPDLDTKQSRGLLRPLCLFIFPLSNFVFNSVLTYRGLREIGFSNLLSVMFNPIVTLPLYGLDLFSTHRAVDLIERGYSSILCGRHHKKAHLPLWRYAIIAVAFFISLFAASPGAYIAYDQMGTTFFGHASVFFGVVFWLLRLTLETNSVNEITLNTKRAVGMQCRPHLRSTFLKTHCLSRLGEMIEVAPDEVFKQWGCQSQIDNPIAPKNAHL